MADKVGSEGPSGQPTNNPLSKKLNKILDIRLDSDKVIISILRIFWWRFMWFQWHLTNLSSKIHDTYNLRVLFDFGTWIQLIEDSLLMSFID